jgi:pilus assembly protein CpaB
VRPQSLIVAVLALVFGGSAAVGVNAFIKNRGASASESDMVPVVITAMDLPRGGTITAELVATRDYPKAMVPAGALTKLADVIDRAVAIPMVKDEPVLDAKLSPKGAGRGLAALVPQGLRAVTIQTPNVATGVAGFVMPGNKVDVLLTVTESGGITDLTGGGSTTTLLQKVEILAVDQRVDAPADNKVDVKELRSVTLLVTPRQANLLDLGQNKGTLRLSLRNLNDERDAGGWPVTLADLRFRQEKPWDERIKGVLEAMAKARAQRPVPPPPAPVFVPPPSPPSPMFIRTLRGTREGVVTVRMSDPASLGRVAGGPGN